MVQLLRVARSGPRRSHLGTRSRQDARPRVSWRPKFFDLWVEGRKLQSDSGQLRPLVLLPQGRGGPDPCLGVEDADPPDPLLALGRDESDCPRPPAGPPQAGRPCEGACPLGRVTGRDGGRPPAAQLRRGVSGDMTSRLACGVAPAALALACRPAGRETPPASPMPRSAAVAVATLGHSSGLPARRRPRRFSACCARGSGPAQRALGSRSATSPARGSPTGLPEVA
jgi:hypothetical protein